MNYAESPILIDCAGERMLGILGEPELATRTGVLIIVGGPQYRAGSHRQFTLLARHLARHGIASLRFDYRGMGDSEGEKRDFESVEEDIRAALDAFVRANPSIDHIVLWGLCDGASAALLYAHSDQRVSGLVLLNPWVHTEGTAARTLVRHYYLQRFTSREFWKKAFQGRLNARQSLTSLARNLSHAFRAGRSDPAAPTPTREGADPSERSFPARMLQGLARFDGEVLLVLSGQDYTAHEFRDLVASDCAWQAALRAHNTHQVVIEDADHVFSRSVWRERVADETLQWIAELNKIIATRSPARDELAPLARRFPNLPVLGWSSYTGQRRAPLPGIMNARFRRYTISGRAAIALSLKLLDTRPGDAVLVPTYHCTTMIAPIVQAGLRPMFYPITPQGAPSLDWLNRADLSGVRAILAAHYFGLPQPMSTLREFCDARGIALIEDCAHALFGVSDGRPVGSWGDVAIASLTKFFPVPEGGIIASNTRPVDTLHLTPRTLPGQIKAIADAIETGARYMRFPGLNLLLNGVFNAKNWLRKHRRPDIANHGTLAVHPPHPTDGQLLASTTQPALAVKQIVESVHWARIVENRRRNYLELARQLSGLPGTRIMRPDLPEGAAPYVFPFCVDNYQATYQRLRASGVPIFCWDELWPTTPAIADDSGRDWAAHVFQLGCHQDLSSKDIAKISHTVRSILQPV